MVGGDGVDDGRADHDGIADLREGLNVFRVLMPKPMAMGSFVCFLICSMCGRMESGLAFAAPVMPVTET